jgi:hypothetical protein
MAGDAMYIALDRDHTQHVLAIVVDCPVASGSAIDPVDPPLAWEVWQGELNGWVACEVEYDGTGGFNMPGEVILHAPAMHGGEFGGQPGQPTFYASPVLDRLRVEARGGTVGARHATTVRNEILGLSEGTPGQSFMLQQTPLLARDERQDYLIVESPDGQAQDWTEVVEFADSGANDAHFTLDSADGTLTLGPTLLQPNGSIYRFGATPLKRSRLRFSRYQYGGGVVGNVPRGTLNVLKTSIPYVSQATIASRRLAGVMRRASTMPSFARRRCCARGLAPLQRKTTSTWHFRSRASLAPTVSPLEQCLARRPMSRRARFLCSCYYNDRTASVAMAPSRAWSDPNC